MRTAGDTADHFTKRLLSNHRLDSSGSHYRHTLFVEDVEDILDILVKRCIELSHGCRVITESIDLVSDRKSSEVDWPNVGLRLLQQRVVSTVNSARSTFIEKTIESSGL
jgi:hypothetical protein